MEPDLTPEEQAEACRTVLALARAHCNDRQDDVAVLLADADERELRAIVGVYMHAVGDLLVRQVCAINLIEDDETRVQAENIDADAMAAEPEMRAEVERQIAATQTRLIARGWLDGG